MKRLLLFISVALLLTGCTVKQPPETTQSTPPPTEAPGLYDPESRIEQETDGAVRVYPLEDNAWTALHRMGNRLLLIKADEIITLAGDNCVPETSVTLDKGTGASGVNTAVTGVGYYLQDTREIVVCNPQLQTVSRLSMPEDMIGEPVICMDRNEVFYGTETQIRAIDLKSGISRLIRTQSAPGRMVLQCHFGGEILVCQFTDAGEQVRTEYLSAETGQSFAEEGRISRLQSWQEQYFARYSDGVETHWIFGSKEEEPQVMELPQYIEALASEESAVLERDGVLSCAQTEAGSTVSFFDLETGKKTAQVTLSGMELPSAYQCDGTYIWFLTQDIEKNQQLLCRWDPELSAVQEDTIYAHPLYTADNPDTEGIAACRKKAESLESQYGVAIAIWDETERFTQEYTVVSEHSVKRIEKMLSELEYGLRLLPEKLLQESIGKGKLTISLVRSIAERESVQYWKNGDCFLLLPSEDTLYAFFRTAAYAVDSYVLGNSRDLDDWEELNPDVFSYAYSYDFAEEPMYLEGENRAFADRLAMAYPHEDRCSTFACAMLPEQDSVFESNIMQTKLRQLCLGIREAYGLEQSSETYPWEQYLKDTLAAAEE